MKRIQFNVPEDKLEELDALQKDMGLSTRKELFNNAVTLLQWAVNRKKEGKTIAALDGSRNKYRELVMPALQNVKQQDDVLDGEIA